MALITKPRTSVGELSELFNSFFDDTPSYWTPRADLMEDGNAYHLRVEVPGFEKSDIKVEFEDGILSVSGERKDEKLQDDSRTYFSEIRHGQFLRRVKFPAMIESDKIKANYKDGMLTLEIPKSEKVKATTIQIS